MEFSNKLKNLRNGKGVTLKQVADAIGVTLGAYANYEHGIRQPSFEILVAICKYYGVSADYLLGLKDVE